MSLTPFKLCATAVLALAFSQASLATTNLVSDGNFVEGATAGNFTTYNAASNIGPWSVTSGSVDLIGTYWQQTPNGSYSVDLNGNNPGGISQTLNLAAGSYQLSFYLASNPDANWYNGGQSNTVAVAVGNASQNYTVSPVGHSVNNMGFQLETLSFTTAAATTLSFNSLDKSGATGPVVGGVSVAAVPEPSSLALMFAGLAIVGGVSRRRKNRV